MKNHNNIVGQTPVRKPFICKVFRDTVSYPMDLLLHMQRLHPRVNLRNEELEMDLEEPIYEIDVEAPTQPTAPRGTNALGNSRAGQTLEDAVEQPKVPMAGAKNMVVEIGSSFIFDSKSVINEEGLGSSSEGKEAAEKKVDLKRPVEETVVEATLPPPSPIALPPTQAVMSQNEAEQPRVRPMFDLNKLPHMFDLNKLPDEQD